MPFIGRATLPEEFYDITSDMLLLQPEPQYLYASLWKKAMSAELSPPAMFGLPGRSVAGVGAPYDANNGRLSLSPDVMTETFAVKVDMMGGPGTSLRVNRPRFSNSTYTMGSRLVASNSTISTTPINVSSEQITLTLQTFAGPYDQTNSRVAPYGLTAFDANFGVHKQAAIVGAHMKRDFDRFLDTVMVTLLDSASSAVYPKGMTAVNDATAAGMYPCDYDTINRAEKTADEANVPTFADGYRGLVLTPTQLAQLKGDPQYAKYAEKHPEFNALFPGYVATVNKMHVFKSTTLNTTANSSSVNIHYGHLFGPGVLGSAMGRRPAVYNSTDDNYGQQVKVIWLMDSDFVLADNRFVVSVRSSA